MHELLALDVRHDEDVVIARRQARQAAAALGFDVQGQTRVATCVSELVRNAHRYADGGRMRLAVADGDDGRQRLCVTVADTGPGIPHLDEVLGGRFRSSTGMGQGLLGTRRLADEFQIDAAPGTGTRVEFTKRLPTTTTRFGATEAAAFRAQLARERPSDAYAEVRQQNQELMRTLAELRERQEEVDRLNSALAQRGRDLALAAASAEEARRAADVANRAKGDFLAVMSHELRTPLGAILGYTRLLEMGIGGTVSTEQSDYLAHIVRAQAHLLGLIDDLLAFAKLESGSLPLQVEVVHVPEVCATVETLTSPQLAARGLRYRCVATLASAPALRVRADAGKVLQVLVNLVANATKFTASGGEIVLSAVGDAAEVRITVRDSGQGIPEDRLEAIFDPFVQVERRLRGTSEGVGLGLAISRELARAMGGDLHVVSRLGEGSAFTLTLPRG